MARLPFIHEYVIERLVGLKGGAAIYRSLARLREAGLLATIKPPLYPCGSQELYYLTDLGLATLAIDHGVELVDLVNPLHLGGRQLLSLLPHLEHLVAAYDLLGALAASREIPPVLLAWERPHRCRYQRPTAKAQVSVKVPAYVALSWDGEPGAYFLVPDRGTVPLRLYRPLIQHLFAMRHMEYETFPILVVATWGERRKELWEKMLDEVRRERNDFDLLAQITLWGELRSGLTCTEQLNRVQTLSVAQLRQHIPARRLTPRRSNGPLPRPVGDALLAPRHPPVLDDLEQVALHLCLGDYELLDLLAEHPFLPPERMAIVLGGSVRSVRRRRNRLLATRLMRLLEAEEIGDDAGLELPELTAAGLERVAAHRGLSPAVAVREVGLVGGGPGQPFEARRRLLTHLTHTMGADEIFVRLYQIAGRLRESGGDDAVLEWQNTTACSRHHLRPDGYGLYQRHGWLHHLFVEYDRGTMRQRGYLHKFDEYHRYNFGGRYERDYGRYPVILMVTSSNTSEERIARVAQIAAGYWGRQLPLLLICQWRVDEASNFRGLLGPIWREPGADFGERRFWLADKSL
ncbi:MAG: replication-relaxation family protein [Chloroflexota bacterium]|nr:MAG: hypothetical protein DLM70_15245 [Chloroflexota bacterium]